MTGYKIYLMENGKVDEIQTFKDEESYGFELEQWYSCNYYVEEVGNVAYVQTDKNHDNDCDYLDDY